ncbi:MAG TPA: trypsin-like peptidase domain-containing protein [Planctomycetota bacterium]
MGTETIAPRVRGSQLPDPRSSFAGRTRRLTAAWILTVMAALPAAVRPAAAQDPVVALEKRVQETARKASAAFVFLSGGSGVLISEDGWFLTNHHVVAPLPLPDGLPERNIPERVRVNLQDAKQRLARLVCTDPVGDIALLKLEPEAGEKLPFLEFADSDRLETGQYVLAIGAPFSIGAQGDPAPDHRHYPSVSLGVISAIHRYQEQYGDCIQTDAAVNPGNSGGPLVDLDGRLAGINGRILTRFGNRVNSGVGFAVPANQIRNFLPRMKSGGIDRKIYHGRITGLAVQDPPTRTGALVADVRVSSVAAKAGFKEGDLIVAVNSQKVATGRRFLGLISTWPAGSEITVTVRRGDETVDLKAKMRSAPARDITGRPLDPRAGAGRTGATFEEDMDGVVVTFVSPLSPADDAGLAAGDLVVKVDGNDVGGDLDGLLVGVRSKKPGEKVKLLVRRDGKEREVTITLGRPKE